MADAFGKQDIYATLFPREISKAEQRQVQIIEAAIDCFATLGVEKTTYESIASKCGVSRTLVVHYFPNKEELIKLVLKYIRADGQNATIDGLKSGDTPEAQFKMYVKSHFKWLQKKPNYWGTWILLSYYAGLKADFRQLHTELSSIGFRRIAAILGEFPENKKASAKVLSCRAKVIQALIIGALGEIHTQDLPIEKADYISEIVESCLLIAKNK